jgi:hypothetical protein
LVVLADTLAQFNAADVGHTPICDYKLRLVFIKQIHGLAAILRQQNGVVLFRERLLDQFAIYRGIICYQDLDFTGRGVHFFDLDCVSGLEQMAE